MKFLNKLMNIFIILLILCILISIIVYFLEPLLYKNNTKGKELNEFSNYDYIQRALGQYLMYYNQNNTEALMNCTAILKRGTSKEYTLAYEKYIKDKYKNLEIESIYKSFGDKYIINFSINVDYSSNPIVDPEIYKIILKIDNQKGNFQIYYDNFLDLIQEE